MRHTSSTRLTMGVQPAKGAPMGDGGASCWRRRWCSRWRRCRSSSCPHHRAMDSAEKRELEEHPHLNKSTRSSRSSAPPIRGMDAQRQEEPRASRACGCKLQLHACMWNACMRLPNAYECVSWPSHAAAWAMSNDRELCSMPHDDCSFHPSTCQRHHVQSLPGLELVASAYVVLH